MRGVSDHKANVKFLLDPMSHTGTGSTTGYHSRAAPDLRPGASLTAAAASHSSAACAQRAPLSEVRTYLRCDSHALNELPSAGQRGVAEQSQLDSALSPTSEWLESVVSLRLQNREVLQQRFPYPIRRSLPEKGSLYYAGFNKVQNSTHPFIRRILLPLHLLQAE